MLSVVRAVGRSFEWRGDEPAKKCLHRELQKFAVRDRKIWPCIPVSAAIVMMKKRGSLG